MLRAVPLLLTVVALVAPGCGSDDSDPSGSDGGDQARTDSTARDSETGLSTTTGESSEAGDESGQDSEGTETPSRAEYIARADRICMRAQRQVGVEGRKQLEAVRALQRGKIEQPEYYRRTGTSTAKSADYAGQAVTELERLPRPKERRDALEAYLEAAAEQVRLLTEQAAKQRQGEARAVIKLNQELERAGGRTHTAAKRFGFHTCGGT